MKKIAAYILTSLFFLGTNAQYYLRGEIQDEKKAVLQNVKLKLKADKMLYYSGASGGFGISTTVLKDSLTLSLEGYETKTIFIRSDVFQSITMKALFSKTKKHSHNLISVTRDHAQSQKFNSFVSDESYFSLVENEEVNTAKFPNTSFSLNVNKASYSNIRRFLNMNSMVPPDAVRIEELLNYFTLHYKEPENDEVFKIESQFSDCPWNNKSQLLYLSINARKLDMNNVPPCNLVFLIDASGSMDMPNRLPLVKGAFQMLVKNLRAIDTVSIVIYGGTVSVWLPPTGGNEKQKIIKSIEELVATGDTPGESAIKMAYNLARKAFIKGGNNRVILATDGDFNVGETSEKALDYLITNERKSGVYLTCLGVGMGNFKDSKLETLAKSGNGNYAYLDDIKEAEKVLVKEVTQTFFAVADDVFLNVNFNPQVISQYRLIGFDNKREAISDTASSLEGGEVGSGNSVLAIFEVVRKYADTLTGIQKERDPVASVSLNYSVNNSSINRKEIKYNCINNYAPLPQIDKEYQFATALVMFGMKLRQSKFVEKSTWNDIQTIATNAYNPNDYLQTEFVRLINVAKKVYPKNKKNKKR